MLKRIIDFMRYNRDKKLTIAVWFWASVFRPCILFIPAKYMKKFYGIEGEESPMDENEATYWQASRIAHHVNRVSSHTPWESKCLVRALTAQKLLTRKKIASTLYLGVGRKGGKMVAHAWIRTGSYYLTGGMGEDYAIVARFRK